MGRPQSSADCVCFSVQHIEQMKATATMKPRDLHRLGYEFTSIFLSNESFLCAQLAAGSCFNAVDSILGGQVRKQTPALSKAPLCHTCKDLNITIKQQANIGLITGQQKANIRLTTG